MSLTCLVFLRKRLYLLPIVTAIWIICSFFISYGIAVGYGHTEPDFPYISHTAIEAPERCVFGQLVNVGALMLGMNVLVRYLFLKEIFRQKKFDNVRGWQKANIVGIILGIISAFGISMVANFQTVVLRGPHYVGAGLAFGLGLIYCWLQTRITWRLREENIGSRKIAILQLINSIALTGFVIIFGISKTIYKVNEIQGNGTKYDSLRGVYLTSTISEWLLAISVLTYTLTYTWDFKSMILESPKVTLDFDQLQQNYNNNTTNTTTTVASSTDSELRNRTVTDNAVSNV